jgi:outer membrane protein assembly factor BamB
VVPRPVYADGLLLSCGGSDKLFMYCIRPAGASGDITDATNLVWKSARNIPSMPSPLMAGNRLYILNAATMSCLEPATGNTIWARNLSGQHLASPVAAEERIYLFNTTGGGSVVAQGDTFRVLATNRLDSGCYASPAVVGHSLLVRTTSHLYRIGK